MHINYLDVQYTGIKRADDTRQKWNEITLKDRIRVGEIIRNIQIAIQQVQGQKYPTYEEMMEE